MGGMQVTQAGWLMAGVADGNLAVPEDPGVPAGVAAQEPHASRAGPGWVGAGREGGMCHHLRTVSVRRQPRAALWPAVRLEQDL